MAPIMSSMKTGNFESKTAAFWNFFAFDRLDLNFRFTDNHQPTQ